MKRLLHLVLCLLVLTCKDDKAISPEHKSPSKKVDVISNANIHLSHIVELFVWPGDYPTRPIIVSAQQYFEPYKNHPAIQLSDSIFKNEIFYFDELTEILLYLEPLPNTTFKYPIENTTYNNNIELINRWIKTLSEFYIDTDFETFLNTHQSFYEGAHKEVKDNLPPNEFVQQMEDYYRDSKVSYTIIPAPEMPTGGDYGYRGIGPYVYTDDGLMIYQVISASLPIKPNPSTNTYDSFGFDNKTFILRNSYHEFGHAFVNPILAKERNKILLENYRHLFTPELQKTMLKQNYDNWSDCIAEHLVRLGEIRLAERSGDSAWAEELRVYHIDELGFVFLPELETQILKYEQNPKIKTFEEFLPKLLEGIK